MKKNYKSEMFIYLYI